MASPSKLAMEYAPLGERKNNESSVNFLKFSVSDPPLSMLATGFGNATLEGLKKSMNTKSHQEIFGDRRLFWEMQDIFGKYLKRGHSKISSKICPRAVSEVLDPLVSFSLTTPTLPVLRSNLFVGRTQRSEYLTGS